MKKAILFFTFIFSLMACNSGSANKGSDVIIEIDKAQFMEKIYNYEKNPQEWVYEGSLPCIVDFYANWCGPCKALSPTLEKLAKEYEGKIVIYKVNVDKEQELSRAFGISSIPALLWCPAEGEPSFTQGALPQEQLKERIDNILIK